MNGSECKMYPEPQGGESRRGRAEWRRSRNLQSVRKNLQSVRKSKSVPSVLDFHSGWECLVNAPIDKHIRG